MEPYEYCNYAHYERDGQEHYYICKFYPQEIYGVSLSNCMECIHNPEGQYENRMKYVNWLKESKND